MNEFKAVSAVSTRKGWWMDYETNRQNKRRSRRKSRHELKKFSEILQKELDKHATT